MRDTAKDERPFRIPSQREPKLLQEPDPSALVRLLEGWMHGDETEQRETFEFLRQSLDEGRPAGYKFFS